MTSGDEAGHGRPAGGLDGRSGEGTALEDLLATVAAGGLPGSLREFPDTPLPEGQALQLVAAAERLGLCGFMLLSVRSGRLSLPPVAIDALDEAQLRESTTRLYLEQELRSVSAVLDEVDIESRVVEGCAVAHLDYRDIDVRAVTRLDLLLHARDLGRAAELLRRQGWRPPKSSGAQPERGLSLVGPSGPRLVLHDDADTYPELVVDVRQLWADGEPFIVGGRKVKGLGSEQRVIYTSTVASDPHPLSSLIAQRDLVEMVLFGEWRRPRLMSLAASWNAQGILATAVDTAWRRLAIADVTALSVWAEAYQGEARRKPARHPENRQDQPAGNSSWVSIRSRLARHS